MRKAIGLSLLGVLFVFVAGTVLAQDTTSAPETDSTTMTTTTSNAGAFEQLSPGNQMITQALFEAQQVGPESESAWNLDQIAAAKQSGLGWGNVFKEMQSQGLIQEKNLGQVVSKFQRQNDSLSAADTAVTESTAPEPAADSTATAATTSTTETTSAMTTTSNAGAFEQLSPGNQKITQALFGAQQVGPESESAWNLDQIAGAKQSGLGWGEVFTQMQSQGLIQEKNLGQVVSKFEHQKHILSASSGVVITTGSGRPVFVDVKKSGYAAGPSAKGQAAANKHHSSTVESITRGVGRGAHVTTARGAGAPFVTGFGASASAGAIYGGWASTVPGHGYSGGIGQGSIKSAGKRK